MQPTTGRNRVDTTWVTAQGYNAIREEGWGWGYTLLLSFRPCRGVMAVNKYHDHTGRMNGPRMGPSDGCGGQLARAAAGMVIKGSTL